MNNGADEPQVFDSSGCMTLSDQELELVCTRLPRLHTVVVNGCFMITDSGLASIGVGNPLLPLTRMLL